MDTAETKAPDLVPWLVESWTGGLAEAIEVMTGDQPHISWRPSDHSLAENGPMLWWEQPFAVGEGAAVWIGAPEKAWTDLGTYTLRGAGIEASEPADARNTYLEMVSQGLASLAKAIGGRLSTRVAFEGGREVPAPPESAQAFEIDIRIGDTEYPPNWFRFSRALLAAFEKEPAAAGVPDAPAEPGEIAPQAETALAAPAPSGRPKTMDLLLELELPVSVSFGRAQMPLKDVLKLTTGSIVELNRAISEPVEVIVNNCVIARGEVVVVEGNYGVRIHEIISRERRLRTLG